MALVLIAASVLFGWNLGTWFSVGMVALAGAATRVPEAAFVPAFPSSRLPACFFAMTPIWSRRTVRSTTNRGSKKARLS